jgi:hypothetical protein
VLDIIHFYSIDITSEGLEVDIEDEDVREERLKILHGKIDRDSIIVAKNIHKRYQSSGRGDSSSF